ncbi:RE1 [Symbiodinium sp. KB8]|nr:RE1 [Symbiodinium sp. KB8]
MTRLCSYDPELSSEGALAEAITVFNHRDMVRGFSPAQHVIGRGADDTDRFVEAGQGLPPGLLVENPEGEFARAAKRRAEAEKIHADWNARQRIGRAVNSRHRPCYNYVPGELVFFWRSQESGKGRRQPGTRQGRFLGPARILATETRKSDAGELSPGGAVWLVRGRNLIKCAPEQLRRATEREEILEGLSAQAGQPTPWTFTQVAETLGGNQFQDATKDVPELQEWRRAQEASEAPQPTRLRFRTKRPAPVVPAAEDGADAEMEPSPEQEAAPLQRPRLEPQGRESGLRGECWWNTVPEQAWPDVPTTYWDDRQAAVEVEVPIPETRRGILQMSRNFEGYFVGQMKRKAVEVSERRLSPSEQEEFRGAKQVEVKNFLSADAFQALPKHLQPSRDQAVGMRWVLTWKVKEDGTRKAKARAVLLGYQDPCYEHRSTTAPVMTRQSRQMLLQMAAWKRWRVRKGDVSGAFLQGREYPDTLYCVPTPEICEAMNLPENSVTKIKRACYGLVDAPLEWYRTVDSFLQNIGMERCSSDACMWCYRDEGELKGLISGHVDDFIFGGDDAHQGWCEKLRKIQEQFRWGDWETDKFTQCGVLIETTPQGFSLSQPSYLEGISEIGVNATRRKARSQHKMLIHGFTPDVELGLVAWVDAASQSRVDGGASEALAAINGEDNLYYARFQWSELLYGKLDLRHPDLAVRKTFGCLVTDSRNVYDKMTNEVVVVKGAEKRTSIELLGLKEAQRRTDVIIRWVHSEAQLANSLTKTNGLKELEMFYRMGHRWRIVEDEQMQSARRRKEQGLLPLSQTEGVSKAINQD